MERRPRAAARQDFISLLHTRMDRSCRVARSVRSVMRVAQLQRRAARRQIPYAHTALVVALHTQTPNVPHTR